MIATLLDEWLSVRMEPGQRAWLAQQEAPDISQTRFFLSFSACARACHGPLAASAAELRAADAALPGWQPRQWGQVDVARARLLLAR
ncbi:MAG: hypothetical protein ACOCXJ_08975, partial [Planctomycetota bacterium]